MRPNASSSTGVDPEESSPVFPLVVHEKVARHDVPQNGRLRCKR